MIDKIHKQDLCPKAKKSLDMVKKLRENEYMIAFDNTWANHYKLSMLINGELQEYYFNVYQDMINTLDILLKLKGVNIDE